jgi:hypothetical protein
LADFGGYLGLLLGASLLSIYDICLEIGVAFSKRLKENGKQCIKSKKSRPHLDVERGWSGANEHEQTNKLPPTVIYYYSNILQQILK